jgi:hypothetical protein
MPSVGRDPEVDINLIDTTILEEPVYVSIFAPWTWLKWNYRRFKVTFTVPASESYVVSECFGIPQINPTHRNFECLLLIYFKETMRNTVKTTPFTVEFPCPLQLSQVTFNLAVQVKHPVHVSLQSTT